MQNASRKGLTKQWDNLITKELERVDFWELSRNLQHKKKNEPKEGKFFLKQQYQLHMLIRKKRRKSQ